MKLVQNVPLGAVLWLLSAAACYGADDYMSALEAEADDTAGRGELTQQNSPDSKRPSIQNRDAIKSGLTRAEFEAELDTNYSGSYFLYDKLKQRQRKAVFSLYQEDNRIEAIREEIVRQMSSG